MSARAHRWAWLGAWGVGAAVALFAAPAWLAELVQASGARGIHWSHSDRLVGLALLATVPALAVYSLADLPRWQVGLQAVARCGLLAALVVAAAGPQSRQDAARSLHTVHLIDRSRSVPDALLVAAAEVVGQTDLGTPAGVSSRTDALLFDAAVVPVTRGPAGSAVALPRHASTADATDLEGALNAALGMLDPDSVRHVVVWSDGLETVGDAAALAPTLRAAGVRVHRAALSSAPPLGEVVAARLEVPPRVRARVPFAVAMTVEASGLARARCALIAGDARLPPVVVDLPIGPTRVELGALTLATPGVHEISARCDVIAGADRFGENNQLRGRIIVDARPRVLYVEGAAGQSSHLARALQDAFDLEVLPADGLPRSLAGLRRYQAVIVSDVPRVSAAGVPLLTDGDMRNLDAYVRGGGGLLVVGGENSLGSGGYQDTWLDRHVLPVRLDVESRMEAPTIAMVLCIDKSGSMAGGKMELAKEAARATAESLQHEDRIGVVAFDSEARTAVRLQRAGNRYRIATDISKLQPSGGTHIYPALEQAHQTLVAAEAKVKHVIVMTDGQAPRAGIDALVRQMRRAAITVSAVGVGTDVDRGLLEAIADRGGGRAYFTDRPETLPRIFVRETKLIAGETVKEQVVRAMRAPGLGRIDALRGVPFESAPALTGYLPTKVKAGAEELLRLTTGAPLYVRWKLGAGKVGVWTSDLKNRWAAAWVPWPGYAVLARQLVRDALQEETGLHVDVQLQRERDRLLIATDAVDEADAWLTGLIARADVQDPAGRHHSVALAEVAAGRYEGDIALAAVGAWDVRVDLTAVGAARPLASGRATTVHPYADEYRLPDASALATLDELARRTGGVAGATARDWTDTGGARVQRWQPLWPDVLRWALILLILDVGLRRIRLGRAVAARWWDLGGAR
ncbi:MAG: VWA domain-containing protein [Myxococcales bacterium]|nr:VWA domain-containing protein [Myxococcales bacterium]